MKIFAWAAVFLMIAACDKKKSASESELDAETKKFFKLLKADEFCGELKYLTIRDDGLKNDLGLICENDRATDLFAKLIADSYRGEGQFDKFTYSKIEENEGDKSSFLVAFSHKIPKLSATNIRDSNLKTVLQNEINLDQYQRTVEKISETSEPGLNFLRQTFRYKTLIKAPQSTEFRNERVTEVNHYQVSVKREDLALSTEHLLDGDKNKDYEWARTITLVIGDPKEGGSFLVSIVDFKTWNQGFHKINIRALEALTKKSAQDVFDYLVAESRK